MKKMYRAFLVALLFLTLCTPAFAAEENSPIVSSVEELQTAIEKSEFGDTIIVANTIRITDNCIIGKNGENVNLVTSDDFCGDAIFIVEEFENQDITIQSIEFRNQSCPFLIVNPGTQKCNLGRIYLFGLSFYDNACDDAIIQSNGAQVIMENCSMIQYLRNARILKQHETSSVILKNCTMAGKLINDNGGAIWCDGELSALYCTFAQSHVYADIDDIGNTVGVGSAIFITENGNCAFNRCRFEDNYSANGGCISVLGSATLTNCNFWGNDFDRSKGGGADVYVWKGASLKIDYAEDEDFNFRSTPVGFFLDNIKHTFDANGENLFVGMSVDTDSIPLAQYGLHFAYVDEFPEGYEIPTEPDEIDDVVYWDDFEYPEIPVDPEPEEPGDEPELPAPDNKPEEPDTPTTPEEPTAPEGSGEPDDPTNPEEPGDMPQNPAPEDTPEESGPQTPQEPSGGHDTDDGDFTPPTYHKPTTKPTAPIEAIPEETTKPKTSMACGTAVIDCSRSAKLQGYGDGQLHEDAPLSRAQMAVIVYRLLDDESMAVLSAPSSSFTDVDADAWYAPSVLALADAGVVGGTGNGYFAPDSPTTWAQLLTVLGRFVEQQECALQHIRYDGWARPAIETAVALGWIEDSAEIVPDDVITRGAAVDLINMVLKQYR